MSASDKAPSQDHPDRGGSPNENPMKINLDELRKQKPPAAVTREIDKMAIAKWKIKSAYYYLAFTSVLCLAAILIDPSEQVLRVVLAVLAMAGMVGLAVLRWSNRKI